MLKSLDDVAIPLPALCPCSPPCHENNHEKPQFDNLRVKLITKCGKRITNWNKEAQGLQIGEQEIRFIILVSQNRKL